ncbi:MAG: beta-propeller fold lactonase family protein [Gammaproteobacteria bacterium]|nr:beta-propeller fold lactonase family protein [Gammaproteobacteria bacterium]
MTLEAHIYSPQSRWWIPCSLLAVVILMLVAGGVSSAQAGPQRFAFSANNLDASLARYSVDTETGQLRFLDYMPLGKSTPEVVLDPSGRFVLATSQSIDRVYVFRLDPANGKLNKVPGSPFDVKGRAPFSIIFHPSGRFLYMAHRYAGVGAYTFNGETGAVAPLPDSSYPAQSHPRSVVLHPSSRFLYAMNAYSNSISIFRLDQKTGALTEMPGSPVTVGEMGQIDYLAQRMQDVPDSAGGLPYHMTLDPQGRFAFVVNAASANISVFRLNAEDGHLTEVEGSPFFAGFNPYSVTVHPSGRFVYVARPRDHLLEALSLDAETGRLTPLPGSPFSSGGEMPAAITFNADGRHAYVINMLTSDVVQMDVDLDTGALEILDVVKTRSAPWAFTLAEGDAPAPAKAQLFISLGENRLGRLQIAVNGRLHQATAATVASGIAVAVKPGGEYAYVADRDKGTVMVFRFGSASEKLQPLADGVVAVGASPSDIAVDLNGWYLYVTNAGDNSLSIYYLDPDSGLPKPVRGSPVSTGQRPVAITLDPASRYAYVVNNGSDNISVYRYRNNVTPLIFESVRHGSPYAAGKAPVALAVDPTGRYAYVANAGSNDISAYRIHHQTGALSALPGSPFKAGRHPLALATHPGGRFLYAINRDSADLTLYHIETALGAIAPVGKPLKLPMMPKRLWLSASGEEAYVLSADGERLLRFSLDAESGEPQLRSNTKLSIPIVDLAPVSSP